MPVPEEPPHAIGPSTGLRTPKRTGTERRPRLTTSRKIVLVILVALGLARLVAGIVQIETLHRHDDTPQAQGYRSYGTANGATFWLRSTGTNEFAFRITGTSGAGCRYAGSDLMGVQRILGSSGYLPLCTQSSLTGVRLVAYLVPATYAPVAVTMSDGSVIQRTASISSLPSEPSLLPQQRIDVVMLGGNATVSSVQFG